MHQLARRRIQQCDPDTARNMQAGLAVGRSQLLDPLAQRLREFLGVIELSWQQYREPVARNAGSKGTRRQPVPDQLAQLPQYRVTHMHAETVIDDMQLVCIDIEGAPVSGPLRV